MIDNRKFGGLTPTWCPGCGDWAIATAIKQSLTTLGYDPSSLAIVFGIGCSGNMNDFLNAYAFHALHGRAVSTAVGVKLADHALPVLVIAGDGDTYGEGGNHLLHASRGNHDITLIVHDNGVYGLTTGQVAPTALKGVKSKSTPTGIIERPVSPLELLISQGATFVAQSFAGDLNHLTQMVSKAVQHKGFSVVNVLQPCVTFNQLNTYQYYFEKVYKLPKTHDMTDYSSAMIEAARMMHEEYALGILYDVALPAYHEQVPALFDDIPLINKNPITSIHTLLDDFK